MLIFLSSPYSDKDKSVVKFRAEAAAIFAAAHVAKGNTVFSPIVYGHTLLDYREMPSDWQFWQNFCKDFLEKCDELWVLQLPGWEKSSGIQAEIAFAKEKNIPIKYIPA